MAQIVTYFHPFGDEIWVKTNMRFVLVPSGTKSAVYFIPSRKVTWVKNVSIMSSLTGLKFGVVFVFYPHLVPNGTNCHVLPSLWG